MTTPIRSALSHRVSRALENCVNATDAELLCALREHPAFADIVARIDAQIAHREREVRMLEAAAAIANDTESYERLRVARNLLTGFTMLRATLVLREKGG